jgi:hypothetical protein
VLTGRVGVVGQTHFVTIPRSDSEGVANNIISSKVKVYFDATLDVSILLVLRGADSLD